MGLSQTDAAGTFVVRETTGEANERGPAVTQPADPGRQVFADAGCGSCHTLAAAGASGTVGPNLDQLRPSAARVSRIVRNGGQVMPAFGDRLDDAEIQLVAAFVASSAGR